MSTLTKLIRVAVALCLILFILFMLFLCTNLSGCYADERRYFEVQHPGCKVDIVDRTELHTKAMIYCQGADPEEDTVRRR